MVHETMCWRQSSQIQDCLLVTKHSSHRGIVKSLEVALEIETDHVHCLDIQLTPLWLVRMDMR